MKKYYLNLFSPATYSSFLKSDRTITGFSIRQKGHANKVELGDRFICYMTKVSRFFGLFEVQGKYFIDDKPIFTDENDPFVVRFKINPLILLPVNHSLPIKEDVVWEKLSFTKNATKNRTQTWSYNLQGSLAPISDGDSDVLISLLESQLKDPKEYPYDEVFFNKSIKPTVKRADDKVVEITIPDEDSETEQEVDPKSIRKSHRVQSKLAELGEKLGFRIWIAKSDRNKVLKIWKPKKDTLIEDLNIGLPQSASTIVKLIDVLWLKNNLVVRAFEVEETTMVYSGLLRMTDLMTLSPNTRIKLHIVAAEKKFDKYDKEVNRPTFAMFEHAPLSELCTFLSYESLDELMTLPHVEHSRDTIIDDFITQVDSSSQ